MFIPKSIVEWLGLNVENVRTLHADLAACRAERDALKVQLAVTQNNFEWSRLKLNQLEMERSGLIERAYNIKLPVPEIIRTAVRPDLTPEAFSYDDVGDMMAKQLGMPLHNEN